MRYTPHEWNKSKRKGPSLHALACLEANASQVLRNRPRLPKNERVADQMISGLSFSLKLQAFFYALFWLILVPTVPAAIAAIISLFCGCYLFTAECLFVVVFGPLFLFKGVLGNVQKRLYVAYCLGFRGARTALVIGWDGHEYEPDFCCCYWRRY